MTCSIIKPALKQRLTLKSIITAYAKHHQRIHDDEMKWFATAHSRKGAIEKAAKSIKKNGKMHSHQCRIGHKTLNIASNKLECAEISVGTASNFSELHQIVKDEIAHIHRVGDLAIYDIAERIGTYRNIYPKKIYLHAGPKQTARALGFSGLQAISVGVLQNRYPEFSKLKSASHIENCLCIYKSEIIDWRLRTPYRLPNNRSISASLSST